MENKISLKDALQGDKYQLFLEYCLNCNYCYLDELTGLDYIAFGSKYGITQADIKKLKLDISYMKNNNMVVENTIKVEIAAADFDINGRTAEVSLDYFKNINTLSTESRNESSNVEVAENSEILIAENETYTDYIDNYNDAKTTEINNINITAKNDNVYIGESDKIEAMCLSARALNALHRLGIFKIAQLLEKSEEELIKTKNLGVITLKEIFDAISHCSQYMSVFTPEKKSNLHNGINAKILVNINEAIENILMGDIIDISLNEYSESEVLLINDVKESLKLIDSKFAYEAYYNPKKVIPIVEMLDRFSSVIELTKELDAEFDKIPSHRLEHYLSYYIGAIKSEKATIQLDLLSRYLGKIKTVSDLKKTFEKVCTSYSQKKAVECLLSLLQTDLVEVCNDVITKALLSFKSERMEYVIRCRFNGDTLETIGSKLNVTRERVRQIESKAKRVLMHHFYFYGVGFDIISFISADRNGDKTITKVEFLDYFSSCKDKDLIFFLLSSEYKSPKFEYDKKLELFEPIIDKNSIKLACERLSNLDNILPITSLNDILNGISSDTGLTIEIILIQFKKIYKLSGTVYYKERLSNISMYEYTLKSCYPYGIKLYDGNEMNRFKNKVEDIFGEKDLPENNRAIEGRISDVTVLFDRGMYIHPSYIQIDNDLTTEIEQFIIDSERITLPYHEIFEAFKEKLLLKSNISNRYSLQGVLKTNFENKYFFSKDYISKERDATFNTEIESFIKEHGEVHKSEIFQEFPGISEIMVAMKTSVNKEIISLDNGMYMHSSLLEIQNDDYSIRDVIKKEIFDYPVSTRKLLELLWSTHSDFLGRNDITTHNKLFGVLQYMFSDEFRFSRPFIAKLGTNEMSTLAIIKKRLGDCKEIRIPDIIDICTENQLHILTVRGLITQLNDNFLRVDSERLERIYDDTFDETTLENIKSVLIDMINIKGYILGCRINDFLFYPSVDFGWNAFLLRSIIEKYFSDEIKMVDMPTSDSYVMNTIFTNNGFGTESYEDFLKKVIQVENYKEPFSSLEDILDWVKSEGFFTGEPPKYLIDGSVACMDEYGKIIV